MSGKGPSKGESNNVRRTLFQDSKDVESHLNDTKDAFAEMVEKAKTLHQHSKKRSEHPTSSDGSTTSTPDSSPQKSSHPPVLRKK